MQRLRCSGRWNARGGGEESLFAVVVKSDTCAPARAIIVALDTWITRTADEKSGALPLWIVSRFSVIVYKFDDSTLERWRRRKEPSLPLYTYAHQEVEYQFISG